MKGVRYLRLLTIRLVWASVFLCMSTAEDSLRSELRARNTNDGLWVGMWRSSFTQWFPFADDPRVEVKLPRTYFSGNFTSDGEHIVATSGDDLFVLSHRGTVLKSRKAMFDVGFADVSRDLTNVAFARIEWGTAVGGNRPGRMQYYYGPLDSNQVHLIAEGQEFSQPPPAVLIGWSPGGHEIVISFAEEVRIVNLSTGKFRWLGRGLDPTWSPDGRWIAFRTAEGRARLAQVDSGKVSSIMGDRKILFGLQWSPDSKYLLFSENHVSPPCASTRLDVYRLLDGETDPILSPCFGLTNRHFGWVRNK